MSTVLITGATSGLGAALVALYLNSGDHVIACGRNAQALALLKQNHGEQVDTRLFDITQPGAAAAALAAITEVDIAILNAGTCEYLDVDQFKAALVERVHAANFLGAVYCTEALLPRLASGGCLVYVDSLARLLPFTRSQAYGASKAALHYFARSLEVDLAGRGIGVLTVSPGFIDTPLTRQNTFAMPMLATAEQAAAAIRRGIARRQRNIYFPRLFAIILRMLGMLPESVQVWLAAKLKGRQ